MFFSSINFQKFIVLKILQINNRCFSVSPYTVNRVKLRMMYALFSVRVSDIFINIQDIWASIDLNRADHPLSN